MLFSLGFCDIALLVFLSLLNSALCWPLLLCWPFSWSVPGLSHSLSSLVLSPGQELSVFGLLSSSKKLFYVTVLNISANVTEVKVSWAIFTLRFHFSLNAGCNFKLISWFIGQEMQFEKLSLGLSSWPMALNTLCVYDF